MKLWFGSTALASSLGFGVYLTGFAVAQQIQFATSLHG
jgi:hypothetical protein